jgi:hypothetical protein
MAPISSRNVKQDKVAKGAHCRFIGMTAWEAQGLFTGS